VSRWLALVLTGVLSGILALAGGMMLLARDLPGDTASPMLAAMLAAGAIVLAITGVGAATAQPWASWLRLVVGMLCAVAGFGGLLYMILASLIAAGMFPDVLLQPLNLAIVLVMGVSAATGIGLLVHSPEHSPAVASGPPSRGRTWYVVFAGFAIGVGAAWIWGSLIVPLIPYRCCLV
jgi:hypothetical protein